jgi:hypothetical protein
MIDFSILASNWLNTNCGDCDGADINGDKNVDYEDLVIISDNWISSNCPQCN